MDVSALLTAAGRPAYDALVKRDGAAATHDAMRRQLIDEYQGAIHDHRYEAACETAAVLRAIDYPDLARAAYKRDLSVPLPPNIHTLVQSARPLAHQIYSVGTHDPVEAFRLSEGDPHHHMLTDKVANHTGPARLPLLWRWQNRRTWTEMLGKPWQKEESRIKPTVRQLTRFYRPLAAALPAATRTAIAINAEASHVNAALNYDDYSPQPFEPVFIRHLDPAFTQQTRLPMAVTVYRGLYDDRDRPGTPSRDEMRAKAERHDIDTYHGFESTTLNQPMARLYGPILCEIEVPAGSPALLLDAALPASRHVPVHEVLFPRDSRVQWLDARSIDMPSFGPTLLVHGRYLPPVSRDTSASTTG